MKIYTHNRSLFGLSAGLALLAIWGAFHRPETHSLFDLLSADVKWFLDWPLFEIGKMPVTTLFLIKCTVFVIFVTLLARWSRYFLDKEVLSRTSMDVGQRYATARAFGYGVFLLGLVVGLETSGLNLRSLLVVGGALGVGIGFGLQNIVANFVAGLVILFERPVKVGDLIDVGNTYGEVIRIGARGTWVRTFDNEVVIVPNSDLINTRVTNWTANDRTIRQSVPVGVSYDSDLSQVRKVLEDIARQHPEVLVTPEPLVLVTNFGDNAVNLTLRVSTSRAEKAAHVKSDLMLEIYRIFREHKIEMPLPQRDLHIRTVEAPIVLASPTVAPAGARILGETAVGGSAA